MQIFATTGPYPPSWLHFEPQQLLNFDIDADLDQDPAVDSVDSVGPVGV